MLDLLSIGDSTVDVFMTIDDATVQCDLRKEHCLLCINYADKIPVSHVQRIAGVGNAANNAVGGARLGLKTAIWTILGDDDSGQEILAHFKKEKVATDLVRTDRGKATNYSTVLRYKGERTILVYHEKRTYRLPQLPPAKWVYYTSLGKGHEQLNQQIVRTVRSSGIMLGYNPGTHQLKTGLRGMADVLRACEVVFVNKEEAQRIVGEEKDIKKLLGKLYAQGPKIVVITDGPKGAYAYHGGAKYFCGVFPARPVERTGCGDSFATAFLAARAYGKSVPEAMRWGAVNSASVLERVGAQAGLLTKAQIAARLKKHPRFQVREI